jgi:hypothetical protein
VVFPDCGKPMIPNFMVRGTVSFVQEIPGQKGLNPL